MGVTSLKTILDGAFIQGASKAGQAQGTSGKEIAQRLQSGGGEGVQLDVSLRTGARNFSLGLQALNVGISYINVSLAAHEKLLGVVDKMQKIVDDGSRSGIGPQTARRLSDDFQKLDKEFNEIVQGAELDDDPVLNTETLTEQLKKIGLDPEKSVELGRLVSRLRSLVQGSSEEGAPESGELDRLIPTTEFAKAVRKSAIDFEDGVDDGGNGAVKRVAEQVASVKRDLESNIKYLERTSKLVGDNMDLVRAAGFAFLDLSYQLNGSEDAESVAQKLRTEIRRQAPQAMAQADNLQNILNAGVLLLQESAIAEDSEES